MHTAFTFIVCFHFSSHYRSFAMTTLTRRSTTLHTCALALLLCGSANAQTLQPWMSPDVGAAWRAGFKGQGTTITVIDDFGSGNRSSGNLGTGVQRLRHGEWTLREAAMVAPSASVRSHDFTKGTSVPLATGFNVLNLSYGMFARRGLNANQIGWSAQERSIITDAAKGLAVVSKAAGNDAVPIGSANASGNVDYLNMALKGTASAIYVGALSSNGTPTQRASLASYSNTAGADAAVQRQFLVVGVAGNNTGLYGTSFAAPVVTGYAAILGSKFRSATPTQVTNQLLATARTDTVTNYSASRYGRGEASLSRALAPVAIR
jgi:subtilisin family serine protease